MDDSQLAQVLKSRKVLKEILSDSGGDYPGRNEYDFDEELIDIEPEDLSEPEDYNFTVSHKDISDWKLHVVYLKFPSEDERTSVNIQKANIEGERDKIFGKPDEEGLGNKEDNIIIIVPLKTSTAAATYINYVDNVNMTTEKPDGSSELAKKIIEKGYETRHMGNIQIFHINALTINILKHEMVPKHEIIRNEKEIFKILEYHNCSNKVQFPIIQKHDAVSEVLGLIPGDMVKIYRVSITSGESEFYRICK